MISNISGGRLNIGDVADMGQTVNGQLGYIGVVKMQTYPVEYLLMRAVESRSLFNIYDESRMMVNR